MRGSELLEKMALIAPPYIEEAEITRPHRGVWTRWGVAAACVCVAATAVFAVIPHYLPSDAPSPDTPPASSVGDTLVPDPMVSPTYNVVTTMAANRLYIPGYFTEPLTEQELAAVTPRLSPPHTAYSGYAGFNGEGELVAVHLSVPTTVADTTVAVTLGSTAKDYVLAAEPTTTMCNGVAFTLYEQAVSEDRIYLEAEAVIGGCDFLFETTATAQNLTAVKTNFELVLTCFTAYDEGKPALDAVTAEAIPEWYDRKLTLAQAQKDVDFGAYVPAQSPSGYAVESVRRYKDYRSDYLSILWCKGLNDVRWSVRRYTATDAARMTSVADKASYDMSLYSVPLADSVPNELWEIVQDPIFKADELTLAAVQARMCNGSMMFSVKYGDIVVEVNAQGVTPAWLYRQLIELR